MAESKTISIRIPDNLLVLIDEQARKDGKLLKGQPNRSLVILGILNDYFNRSDKVVENSTPGQELRDYMVEKSTEVQELRDYIKRLDAAVIEQTQYQLTCSRELTQRIEALEKQSATGKPQPSAPTGALETPNNQVGIVPVEKFDDYFEPEDLEDLEVKEVEIIPPGDYDFKDLKNVSPLAIPEGLTNSQEEAYLLLIEFINSKSKRYFRLSGYAGTGKSYLVGVILKWLKKHKKTLKYTLASPTNKAANNLQSICESQGLEVKVTTVAKLLGIQPEINEQSGKQEFKSSEASKISDYALVFIDEFSMIDKDNVKTIFDHVTHSKTQIIFIGDSAQLPPIGEKESAIANHPNIKDFAILKEVVRYEGEIARVAEDIRSDSKWNTQDYPFRTSEDETIFKLSESDWINTALEFFKGDLNSARIIAWRNKTVDSYNQVIRKYLYGDNVEDFILGDILIAKSPVFRKENSTKVIIFNTSEEFTVKGEKTLKTKKFLKQNWEYWEVPVGGEFPLMILTPEFEKKREQLLGEIKKKALAAEGGARKTIWVKEYYPLLENFDNISYAYALTCHKAQGSSIEHVFLDAMDLKGCPDKQKILYTGLTRAKVACYIH